MGQIFLASFLHKNTLGGEKEKQLSKFFFSVLKMKKIHAHFWQSSLQIVVVMDLIRDYATAVVEYHRWPFL